MSVSRNQFIRLLAVLLIGMNAVVTMAMQEHETSGFVPPVDEYDWIQLTSDEWLTFIWDRIQKPQVRADGTVPEKDDFRLMLGLDFEF